MKRAMCAALLIALAGTSAVAHHSYAAYDRERLIEMEGVLETFEWMNPHAFLKVRADDGRLYVGEWRGATAMERAGVDKDTLRRGDRLVLGGNPKRDIETSGIVNIRSVRRLADGWQWSAQ